MKTEKAIFAAGCFWGVQYYFDQVPGVVGTTVGYTGGHTLDPDWHNTHGGATGHAEATLIEFDSEKIDYQTLLKHFFRIHNPTALNAADGVNIGDNYRSAIFYYDENQKKLAEDTIAEEQKKYDKPIVTELSQVQEFYIAEDFHQKFTERTGRGACHVAYEQI